MIITNAITPAMPKNLVIYPTTIPTAKKSVSENVVEAAPRSPINGMNSNGKNVIKIPFNADPATAPFIPPLALPNTPAVALRRNVVQLWQYNYSTD